MLLALLCCPVAAPVLAQGPPPHAGRDDAPESEAEAERGPRSDAAVVPKGPFLLSAARTGGPVLIDGRLSEPEWRDAPSISEFTQVEPDLGAPSERTEVRVLYDSDNLYIGVRAYDSDPSGIIATEMERDALLRSDDHIIIVLDTFHDRRNAFLFRVNALGARGDGLIENNRNTGDDWDGVWYARTSIDEEGWVAEIAIPFKSITFAGGGSAWGFNVERVIRRYNETTRWAAPDRNKGVTDIGDAGVLTGLQGMEQGIGLDIVPSVTMQHLRNWPLGSGSTKLDPSLDVFYRITPSLTGALTFNTDFSEAEVDERQVNLSRFELFFPEKRDFFAQDAGIFGFGGLERNGVPFFSRRIGLDDEEEEVGILAGAKLTGRIGNVNLGLVDVQTEAKGELESKNLLAARASANVLDQSTLGVILTHGDPTTNGDNLVVGMDFNYRNSDFLEDQVVLGNAWVQRSFTWRDPDAGGRPPAPGGELAYGANIEFPNDRFQISAAFLTMEENFRPALGFAPRGGVRQYEFGSRYRLRRPPRSLVRKIDFGLGAELVTDERTNEIETGKIRFDAIKLENAEGDSVKLGYNFEYEVLDEPFEIVEDVEIPAGSYNANRYAVGLETADSRVLSGAVEVAWGGFFSGDRLEIKPRLEWRPSKYLFLSAEYEENRVSLPEGDFTTRLARSRIIVQWSPDISWNTLIQYDNQSDSMGVHSRFRYTLEPGNDVFLVFNHSFDTTDGGLSANEMEVAGKLVWTFRF